jgi:plasmid stability protein
MNDSKESVVAQVLVRQVDESVVESLKRKAAARGTSLEGYAREVLTEAAKDTRAELVARLRARLAEQPRQTSDSTALLRQFRDGEGEGDLG